jgi:beta-N-acetylhexosaminidase
MNETVIKSLAFALLTVLAISLIGAELHRSRRPDGKPDPLERMIGQMIVVGFRGVSPADPSVVAVREQLEKGIIGGVLLLSRNVQSSSQLRALTDDLSRSAGEVPPLIAVDQEGGAVQRLSPENGHRAFPSAAEVASAAGADPLALYRAMAEELKTNGINVNFAPTVDLDTNPMNPIIGRLGRSFGSEPARVIEYSGIFQRAHAEAKVLTAAKHFPGHGSSTTDSHVAFTDISRSWRASELEPFAKLAGDVDMVMVGHLYHPRFSDGAGVPASLSKRAIDVLRKEIGFGGVIVADDMEMAALDGFSFEERIVRAVAAGADLLVFSHRAFPGDGPGPRIHAVISEAVRTGRIPRERIEEAHARIMRMRRRLPRR